MLHPSRTALRARLVAVQAALVPFAAPFGLVFMLALTAPTFGSAQAPPDPAEQTDAAPDAALAFRPAKEAVVAGPTLVIDTFQHDTNFYKQSAAGTLEVDLDEVLIGTRSLRVVSDADGQQVNVRAEGLGPLDLSDVFLRLRVRVEGRAQLARLLLYVSHDGFETFDIYPLLSPAPVPAERLIDDGEWSTLTVALGTPLAAPQVDLTRVTDLQVSVVDDGTAPVTVWLAGLDAVQLPERGVVTVMFDDARSGVYELGLPQAQRFGVRGSVAVITGVVGHPTFMTLEQLQLVERFADWEVVAHHVTPLDTGFDSLSEAELRSELAGVKEWLLTHGFRRGADVIAYPHGLIDEGAIDMVREYFAAGRAITRGAGLETLPPADPYRLRAWSVESTDRVEAITAAIDRAARERSWLILVFHQLVDYEPEYTAQYRGVDFARVMAHLAAADVDVLTFSEAVLGR